MLERSHDMVIGLIGALKSGGCYLPMDPTYPDDRLAGMVEDAKAPVVIVQRDIMARAERVVAMANANAGSAGLKVTFLVVEDFWEGEARKLPATNPTPRAQPHNLAYVIFTSGSTGQWGAGGISSLRCVFYGPALVVGVVGQVGKCRTA